MAHPFSRQNRWALVLMGFGTILMVEYLKIVVFIGDYDVAENSGMDGGGGIRRINSFRIKKIAPPSRRVEDEVDKKLNERGVALEEEEKQRRSEREYGTENLTLRLVTNENGGKVEADRKQIEFKKAEMDGVDADHKSPELEHGPQSKVNEGPDIYGTENLTLRLFTNENGGKVEAERKQLEFKKTEADADHKSPDLEHGPQSKVNEGPNNNSEASSLTSDVVSDDEIYIDTSRPVLNPHPFQYLINSPDVCKNTEIFLLCYVHTAVKHYKRRKRIRETWGNPTNYPDVQIRVVFFVGLPQLNTTDGQLYQEYLSFEAKKYGDIIQEDFLDTYKNLSHKGVGALKWIATYCNHTAYVLKTDDDMFVNMYIIVNHLRDLYATNFRRRLMMCYVFEKMHVDREGGQWSLTKDYFPDDLYPPYCSGMGFVATRDVAVAMYRVSPYVRFLWVDDAFISGVLPAALNGAVNHTTWVRAYCAAFEMGVYTHPTEWYKYVFSHVHNETLYLATWNGLTEIVRNRTIPRPAVIRPAHLADEYIPLHKLFTPP